MEWLYSELWNYFKAYLEDGFKNIFSKFKLKKRLKMISCQITDSILSDFQSEIYYNDLDKYLSNNKVLSNYLTLCMSTDISENHNIFSFISEKVDIFLCKHPQYVAQKSRIHSTISKIFIVAFDSVNAIEDENIRAAVTVLKQHAISIQQSLEFKFSFISFIKLSRLHNELVSIFGTTKGATIIEDAISKDNLLSFGTRLLI